MKYTRTIPIGVKATRAFIAEVCGLANLSSTAAQRFSPGNAGWYARSVDSTYLTGKRVFIFGDATHAVAAAKVASEEMGFSVVGLGTYSREYAREVRDAAKLYGIEPLITDDYLEVEEQVAALQPELVLGTQMERHIAKRLSIPCAVISAPVHVQDFPARYSPQMGFEGANVLFDTWVHPLMMGLEEHLIHMFRDDFEFHDGAAPSHLGGANGSADKQAASQLRPASNPDSKMPVQAAVQRADLATRTAALATATATATATAASGPSVSAASPAEPHWAPEAQRELEKIPFFVRGKAKRNTERYATERSVELITVETLYDAKAHFSR